jgi:cell division protein ZipA
LGLARYSPLANKVENSPYDAQPFHDDIIAVRKVNAEPSLGVINERPVQIKNTALKTPQLMPQAEMHTESRLPRLEARGTKAPSPGKVQTTLPSTIMVFLLAKENRHFAGYELLQSLLASGLRFGEGQLFHRYEAIDGHETILCSLAAATASGVFDLQNIGAFSAKGLCVFMKVSRQPELDAQRLSSMLETANHLVDALDAHLLDDTRQALTEERIAAYYHSLGLSQDRVRA